MATSLQKQLAKIASNSTHQLDLKAQKAAHGKSLLFEPKVASSQDFNTLYRICREGFEELCLLDPRFETFGQSIFSEQSRSEERGLMNASDNRDLDVVLENFLVLAAGRLLLKPTQKAVEWLIRRFRVHELNTECLVLSFLPYHATPLFLSLLSILPKQLPQNLRFLYPSISELQNPTFHTILYTSTNNVGFFTAFNSFILRACRVRHQAPAIMSFWASLSTQAVDGMLSAAQSGRESILRQKQEDILLRVLPTLNEALSPQLSDVNELVMAACMVTTILGAKGHLEDHVLDTLMEAVAVKFTSATMEARLTCLAVLAENRQDFKLSTRVTRRLLKVDSLPERLLAIGMRVPIGRLTLGLILRCLSSTSRKTIHFGAEQLTTLLTSHHLTNNDMQILFEKALSLVVDTTTGNTLSEEQRVLVSTLLDFASESPELQAAMQRALVLTKADQMQVELALQTTLALPLQLPNAQVDEDGDQPMQDISSSAASIDLTLAQLKSHKLSVSSFLMEENADDYILFKAAWLKALAAEEYLKILLQIPVFVSVGSVLNTPVTTFLLRLSADASAHQLARTTALRSLQKLIREEGQASSQTQFVLPYLVALLADRAGGVRQAAAECTVGLTECLKHGEGSGASAQTSEDDPYPWFPIPVLYFKAFLEIVLCPCLEEAILDADSITPAISRALDQEGSRFNTTKLTKEGIEAVYRLFASHAGGTTLVSVKLCLLRILNGVGDSLSVTREHVLHPFLVKSLSIPPILVDVANSDSPLWHTLGMESMRIVHAADEKGLKVLYTILTGQVDQIRQAMLRPAFQRIAEVWEDLPSVTMEQYANVLISTALSDERSPEADMRRDLAAETIRSVKLPGLVLASLFESLPTALNMPDSPPAKKRRRTSRTELVRATALSSTELTAALAKYTLVLELVENSRPEQHPNLVQGLFNVLEELQHYRLQTQSGLVYLQGLAINCLLAIVDKLNSTKNTSVNASSIRADLIVDCIRHSSNAQIQSSALLLISSLAAWQPDTVVHSIMPIFTFMGNTILRQGDDYSAHVTENTLTQVVPPLVESFRKRNTDIIRGASDLLLSFTAAFEHIPSQRRLSLFEHLTRTLGPGDSLFAVLAMLIDAYPTDARAQRFAADLANQFDPSVNLKAFRQFLSLVADVFRQRPAAAQHVLNLSERPKDSHENIAGNLLSSLADILANKQLRTRISKSFQSDDIDTANAQRLACVDLIQEAIRLNQFLKSKPVVARSAGVVLSNIINLLPIIELVQCAGTLLDQQDEDVRIVAVKSVANRVRSTTDATSDEITAILGFVSRLSSLLQSTQSAALLPHVINCIEQLTKKFGKKDSSIVVNAAQIVASEHALTCNQAQVQIASAECLTVMIDILKDEFIPLVPRVLSAVFDHLEICTDQEIGPDGAAVLSLTRVCFELLSTLIRNVPFMMTGEYLDTTLRLLSHAVASEALNIKTKDLRQALFKLMAKEVDVNELFSAFARNLSIVAGVSSFGALVEYFAAVKLTLSSRSKSAVIKNTPSLFDLLLSAFDHRRLALTNHSGIAGLDNADLDQLQGIYNDVALTMVMKLNDATFRPFIVKMAEWATALPKKESEGRMLRITALFSFVALLFGRLKSLVTSYATYVLDVATEVLVNTSLSSAVEVNMLLATLSALDHSFAYDDEQFWQSPHHFDPLALPLVSLLETAALAESGPLSSKVHSTIVSLAGATSSNDQHKSVNTALLKLLRHEAASVRLASVKTERELSEKLGEEWLGMLPEMMPLIAELLEDEDSAVERAGREWVRFLEGVLGESLEF